MSKPYLFCPYCGAPLYIPGVSNGEVTVEADHAACSWCGAAFPREA